MNQQKNLEERTEMTSLESTIATELEKSGRRGITKDGRKDERFSEEAGPYIDLIEMCYLRTPTTQNPNVYGFNIHQIRYGNQTRKGITSRMLRELEYWGLVDGQKFIAKLVKTIEIRGRKSNSDHYIPTATEDISDADNNYDSYIVSEKGKKLFEEHKKQMLFKNYKESQSIS